VEAALFGLGFGVVVTFGGAAFRWPLVAVVVVCVVGGFGVGHYTKALERKVK
jgi:hypothetical protein